MKNQMMLADNYIDTEAVSFISVIDSKINHLGTKSTSTFFFVIVVGGKDVKIESMNKEEVVIMRNTLIEKTRSEGL